MGDNYLDLYGGVAPHNDTDTSTAAAAQVTEESMAQRADRIRRLLSAKKLTSEEISHATRIPRCRVDPIVRSMRLKGEVKDSGQRRPASFTERPCIVWELGYEPTVRYGPHHRLRAPYVPREERERRVASLSGLRRRVYENIKDAGRLGITDEENRVLCEIPNTVGLVHAARTHLVKAGLVDDVGIRRKNPSGRAAIAWQAI